MKKILVTAGSTAVHLDKVRVLTNIFRGRTGVAIAEAAALHGNDVTLLTSNAGPADIRYGLGHVRCQHYRTFDELAEQMEKEVRAGGYDTIIHSAAVSDYRPNGAFVVNGSGRLRPLKASGSAAAKIPSGHDKLYVELVPTFKIVDRIREPWGFRGQLVKFKLQVGMTDEELIAIARKSVIQSKADFIVANCLEWSRVRAYIIRADGQLQTVLRSELPIALLERLS